MFDDRRAVVVEKRGNKVTVLTRDGRFVSLRAPVPDLVPGELINLPAPSFRSFLLKRVLPAFALSLVLVVLSFTGYQSYLYARPAVAYVTLDSWASVEFEVNDKGLIKSAKAFDAEGESLLQSIDYEMKPVHEVAKTVAETPTSDSPSLGEVLIGVVPIEESPKVDEIEKRVEEEVTKAVHKKSAGSEDEPGKVISLRLDAEIREQAQKIGISAARAAVWAITRSVEATVGPGVTERPGDQDPDGPPEEPEKGDNAFPGGGNGNAGNSGHGGNGKSDISEPGNEGESSEEEHVDEPREGENEPGKNGKPGRKEAREDALDAIKESLPEFDWDSFLKDRGKSGSKIIEELTKSLLEELSRDDREESGSDSLRPGKASEPGEEEEPEAGEDDRDDTKPGKPGNGAEKDSDTEPGDEYGDESGEGQEDTDDHDDRDDPDNDRDDREDEDDEDQPAGKSKGSSSKAFPKGIGSAARSGLSDWLRARLSALRGITGH